MGEGFKFNCKQFKKPGQELVLSTFSYELCRLIQWKLLRGSLKRPKTRCQIPFVVPLKRPLQLSQLMRHAYAYGCGNRVILKARIVILAAPAGMLVHTTCSTLLSRSKSAESPCVAMSLGAIESFQYQIKVILKYRSARSVQMRE